jgi:hypothetical protein
MSGPKAARIRCSERKEAAGLCLVCPEPARPGQVRCALHAERHRLREIAKNRAFGVRPRGPRRCSGCKRVVDDHDVRRCPGVDAL